MSKLKLMYDVVNNMKDKEVIKGVLNVEGTKDQIKILAIVNDFEKNLNSGETKLKVSTELDYEGKKVKHESQTEFTMPGGHGCHGHHMHAMLHRQHGPMGHMRHHRFGQGGPEGFQGPEGFRPAGMRDKLSRLAGFLNILNQIKVEENEDQSVLVALNLKELPPELKKVMQERMNHHAMFAQQGQLEQPEHFGHHGFMKEFFTLQEPEIQFNVWLNKARDVEKVLFTLTGKQKNDSAESHELKFKAELNLAN